MGNDGQSRLFPLPRRGGPSRQPTPAPATPIPTRDMGAAVVDCAVYEHGRRRGDRVPLESALEAAQCCEGFAWIGLHDPNAEAVEAIGRHFELHPLAVEDAVHAHQRPKLEVFGDSLFAVLKTTRFTEEQPVEVGEIMVFIGPKFVVTVRHGEGSPLHEVRAELEKQQDLLAIGPSAVLYAVADRVVDDYAMVLEELSTDIDEVEAVVFGSPPGNPAQRIYELKREVIEFRRAVTPLLRPMERLSENQAGLPLDPRTAELFRDVHDHLVRDSDRVTGFDELLNGILAANQSQVQVRYNNDVRTISAWVAIVAVPTMIFGLYGMNFEHMPELSTRYGYPIVLAVTFTICALMYARFKRAGWL